MRGIVPASVIWFGMFGVLATGVHVVIFTVLVELFSVPPAAAAAPSFLCAALVSYFGNRRWTFRSRGAHDVCLPRFLVVGLGGLFANMGITYLVVNLLGLWYGIAIAIVVTVVPAFTYIIHRHWTFAPHGEGP